MATIPDLSRFTDQEKALLARYLSLHAPRESDVPIIVGMVLDLLEGGDYGDTLGEVIAGLTPEGMPDTATADKWLPLLDGAGQAPAPVRGSGRGDSDGDDFWREWHAQPERSVSPGIGTLVEQFLADPFGAFTPDEPAGYASRPAQPSLVTPSARPLVKEKFGPLPDLSYNPPKTKDKRTASLPPTSLPALPPPEPSKIGQVPGNAVGAPVEAATVPFPWGETQDEGTGGAAIDILTDPEFAEKYQRAQAAISGGMSPLELAAYGFQEGPFHYSSDFPAPAAPVQSATGPTGRGRPVAAQDAALTATGPQGRGRPVLPQEPIEIAGPAGRGRPAAAPNAPLDIQAIADIFVRDRNEPEGPDNRGRPTLNPIQTAAAPTGPSNRGRPILDTPPINIAGPQGRGRPVLDTPRQGMTIQQIADVFVQDRNEPEGPDNRGKPILNPTRPGLPWPDDFVQDPIVVGGIEDFLGKNIGQGAAGNENLAPTPAPLPLARMAVNNALPEGAIAIDDTDREWIARAVATEVDPRLATSNPQAYQSQVYGVIDTVLNRTASEEFPDTVEGVLEQPSQFSAINGPQNRNYEVYGEVQNIPADLASPELREMVGDYLADRESGTPSSVGGALHYANPYVSDASNMGWIRELDGPRYGAGEMMHWHGTTEGFTPTEAVLTNSALNAISGATSVSGPFDYGDPAMTSKLMHDRLSPLPQANKQKVALQAPIVKDKSDPVNEYYTALASAAKSAAKQAAQRAESGLSDTYWQQKTRNKDRYGSAPSGGSSSGSDYWQQKAAGKAAQQKAEEKSYGGGYSGGSYTTPTQKTKSYTSPAPQTKTKDYNTKIKEKQKKDKSSYWS